MGLAICARSKGVKMVGNGQGSCNGQGLQPTAEGFVSNQEDQHVYKEITDHTH
jgi:hypothetical protein